MPRPTFDEILLRTAFSFMTCDGHIDKKEITSIMKMAQSKYLFGKIDIETELENMLERINLRLIYADLEIKESELRFLRVLRTMLNISDELIFSKFPILSKDFVCENEFTEEYIKELYQNYFKHQVMPTFDITDVLDISKSVLKEIKE